MSVAPNDQPAALRDDATAAARNLARSHFLSQDERPAHVRDLEIADLDTFLRTLLVTDGTVTRTLEAHTLSYVRIEVVDQASCATPQYAARYLEVDPGQEAVQRRVTMRIGDSEKGIVWAESHIVPDRLPAEFLGVLGGTPDGIGESLQKVRLESARELLWFGLGAPPEWATAAVTPDALTRLYRVVTQGRPALLISESFAVEAAAGAYRLAWP